MKPGAGIRLAPEDEEPVRARRLLLFVRVAQDWRSFLASIPRWRLAELAERAGLEGSKPPAPDDSERTADFLDAAGCDLTHAKEHYARLGGDGGAHPMNLVGTGFAALPRQTIDRLPAHAAWQIAAAQAIYRDAS